MNKWKPIKTAPKDSFILVTNLKDKYFIPVIVSWNGLKNWDRDLGYSKGLYLNRKPTHWQAVK